MESVANANLCTRHDMISWVSYPYGGQSCYVYPRYLLDGTEWKLIDPNAFPNAGAFQAVITGGASPSDMSDRYGSVVVARINSDTIDENFYYVSDKYNSNKFRAAINPSFSKGNSELEFDLLSDHRLSAELIQIVDIRDKVSFLKPITTAVELWTDPEILACRYILVRHSSGEVNTYFGPFEYVKRADGLIELQATSANDFRIARIQEIDSSSIMSIRDNDGVEKCAFIHRDAVSDLVGSIDSSEMIDWIPQKELTETIIQVINTSNNFEGMSKNQIRAIKSAIWNYSDSESKIQLDDTRKSRIIEWLSDVSNWVELPDEITKSVSESIDENKLTEIVLDEKNYPQFKERILNSAGVQERINEEKIRLEDGLNSIRLQTADAEKGLREAVAKKEDAEQAASAAEEQLEKVRDEALAQKREELDTLDGEIESRKSELDRLKYEYERAVADKVKIDQDVKDIINGINDEVATSTAILKSEMLRKVVSAVSGVDLNNEEIDSETVYTSVRQDEIVMADDGVVEAIHSALTQRGGRQFKRNDTVNLMICLTQGYITTFSGLPGTGKTSLCNILAGVLGLLNESSGKRFTEINVENGWTSYKDYIGYYNPLSKTFEKSNTEVYDAMRMLSHEESGNGLPPYVFLLDEANLSPIEHYWSPFLRACDTFDTEGARLSLGGTEVWSIPSHVRFLATVNFDHTTEALSHRFLDRSWVVSLDSEFPDMNLTKLNAAKVFSNDSAFTATRLLDVFGYRKGDVADQGNATLFDELLRVCRSHAFPVSPRSRQMILRYMATASRLMSLESKDSQFAPLDYAFSQKVLPQISGPSESIGPLVSDLLDKCSELKATKKQLDRMREFGENNGFYQYFV